MKLDLTFWKNASSKRRRIYLTLIVFVIALVITVIGSFMPMSSQEASSIYNGLNQTINTHKVNGGLTEYIFLNNLTICLAMFVPIIGPIIGFTVLFDTGVALGAIASQQGYPAALGLIILAITPVFWLEFASYSTAMAASIWLSRRLIQGRWHELKNTAILIAICAALLIVGAVIEVWLITVFG